MGVAGRGQQGLGLDRVTPLTRGRVEVVGMGPERRRGQDGGGELAGRREAAGDGVAVGGLVDGLVDRLADPEVGDRPGPPVGPEREEELAAGLVDRQPPGSLRVGLERGDPGGRHVAAQ